MIINIVFEPCQNHVKDKKISFKLNTLLIRVVRGSMSDTYRIRDTPLIKRVRDS